MKYIVLLASIMAFLPATAFAGVSVFPSINCESDSGRTKIEINYESNTPSEVSLDFSIDGETISYDIEGGTMYDQFEDKVFTYTSHQNEFSEYIGFHAIPDTIELTETEYGQRAKFKAKTTRYTTNPKTKQPMSFIIELSCEYSDEV